MNHRKPKTAKIILGLNLGLYHHIALYARGSKWPKYVILRVCMTWTWTLSFLITSSLFTAEFRLRSLLVIPQIFLST